MRDCLRFFGLLLGLLPVFASAAFDLTWAKRYDPTQFAKTSFRSVAMKPGTTGFHAEAIVAEDVLIASFDDNGSQLASQNWDSPLDQEQTEAEIVLDASGNIHLLATNALSAQKRLAGNAFLIDATPSHGFRILGQVGARNKY